MTSREEATLTGSAALLELVPNARTSALENPRATSTGLRLLINQNATGSITTPKITNPAMTKTGWVLLHAFCQWHDIHIQLQIQLHGDALK